MKLEAESWICNATLIDGLGNPPVEGGAIALEGGRIMAAGARLRPPPGATVLDAGGRTVLPGLINLHSHLFRRRRVDDARPTNGVGEVLRALRNARDALAQGITSTRDLGARDHLDLQLRDVIAHEPALGPRIFASGRPVTRTGGHNHDFAHEADGPDEVRKAVRAELKAGADVIKVMASWGGVELGREHLRMGLSGPPVPAYATFTVAEMRAAVEEAHDAARKVTVHAESSPAILRAVEAGVDCVEHGTHMSREAAEAMVQAGTFYSVTISTVYRRVADADRRQGPVYPEGYEFWARNAVAPWKESLERAVEAGVRVVTGTDGGGDIVMEVEMMVQAGLPLLEALHAATGRAAQALGRPDLGALEPGRWADLLILEGRPDRDPAALRGVWRVFKAGQMVHAGA